MCCGAATVAAHPDTRAVATVGVAAAHREAAVAAVCVGVPEGQRAAVTAVTAVTARGISVDMLHRDDVLHELGAGHDALL
jgi:hypothetical protein